MRDFILSAIGMYLIYYVYTAWQEKKAEENYQANIVDPAVAAFEEAEEAERIKEEYGISDSDYEQLLEAFGGN